MRVAMACQAPSGSSESVENCLSPTSATTQISSDPYRVTPMTTSYRRKTRATQYGLQSYLRIREKCRVQSMALLSKLEASSRSSPRRSITLPLMVDVECGGCICSLHPGHSTIRPLHATPFLPTRMQSPAVSHVCH